MHPEVQQERKPELRGAGAGDVVGTTRTSWDTVPGRCRHRISSLPGSEEWGRQNSLTRSLSLGLETWMDAVVSAIACPSEDGEVWSGGMSHGSCSPPRLPRAL